MKVSVVIPTYHDWDRLGLCLAALRNQSIATECFEVVIVNNDPGDECPLKLLAPNIILINEDKPGSYAARNRGVSVAIGDIIAFTDSDCIPDKNWIKNAVSIFESNPTVDRIAGEISLFKEEKTRNLIHLYQSQFSMNQKKYVDRLQSGITANLFIRRKVFEEVGLFRDDLYSGGDNEWGTRASEKGATIIYSHDIRVNHPSRKTLKEILKKKQRTTGGDLQITISRLSAKQKMKKIIKDLLPPIDRASSIGSEIGFFNKVGILGILWLNKLTGLYAWAKIRIFNGEIYR